MNRLLATLLALTLIGCVTGTDGKKQPHPVLVVIAERGAEHGTRAYLRTHPQDARKFQLATLAIESLVSRTNFNAEELGAVLQTLPIDAFRGVEGDLLVSDVVVIWDVIAQSATRIDRSSFLKPIAAAIARGMRRASQPPAPLPPPTLPAASKYSEAEQRALIGQAQARLFKEQAVMRFLPQAAEDDPTGKIMTAPYMFSEPGFPRTFYADAFQGSNTVLTVRRVGGFGGIALQAPCYFEPQHWIVVLSGDFPIGWLVGEHEACTYEPPPPGLAPAFNVAAAPPWNGTMRLVRKTELTGSITNTAWFHSLP